MANDSTLGRIPPNLVLLSCGGCGHRLSVPVISAFIDETGHGHYAVCEMQSCPICTANDWEIAGDQQMREDRERLWDRTYQ